MLLFLTLLLQTAAKTDTWLPTSAAGYVALFLSISAAGGIVFGWFKFFAHLNGLGERVAKVEKRQDEQDAKELERIRLIDSVVAGQARLLEKVGESTKEASSCSEDMKEYAVEIGVKIDNMVRDFTKESRDAGERLKGVETQLSMIVNRSRRGDADDR